MSKTRSENLDFLPVQARISRFKKSPISYLTKLLNDGSSKKNKSFRNSETSNTKMYACQVRIIEAVSTKPDQ